VPLGFVSRTKRDGCCYDERDRRSTIRRCNGGRRRRLREQRLHDAEGVEAVSLGRGLRCDCKVPVRVVRDVPPTEVSAELVAIPVGAGEACGFEAR
jgi:hypothetical protein